jgi:hypothetical protein
MYSKGVSWIDDCRIPFENDKDNNTTRGQYENKVQVGIMADRPNIKFVGSFDDSAKQGRFPANILVCDDMLNDGVISKTLKSNGANRTKEQTIYGGGKGFPTWNAGHNGDSGSSSRYYNIDKWFENLIDV